MKPFSLFTSVLVASYMCFVDGQQPCTHAGQPGTCKILEQCAPLYALLIKPNKSQQDIDQLRSAHCGFENRKPKVCCTADCLTPDNQRGTCVGVYSCANLANLLTPDISNEAKTFLQRSRCNGPEQYSVCCGPRAPIFNWQPATPTTSIVPVANGRCMLTAYPPDPRTECCGVDSGAGNKIVGGNSTTVDQYPWLAIIEYVKDSRLKLLCGGALISGKYVLTAGHCVVGPVLQVGTPRNVRLGEYDTDNEGPDCIPVEGGGQDCTEGIVVIPIERVIPHPDYNPSNQLRRNDIALLRLRNVAPFTDFIRPICLPTSDITLRPPARFTLFAAGWGAVNESVSRSNVKLHVDLPYKSMAECQPAYNVPHRRIQFWEGQICAGGDLGKDSCKGDSGGPLMYENGRTFEVIGVVSFGPTPCGMEGIPGVYTKVYHYNSWILNQITP